MKKNVQCLKLKLVILIHDLKKQYIRKQKQIFID
jgi:hypothetical protein